MTKEEATALLKSRVDLIKSNYPEIDDYREALEMAIEVLKQEPCEDAISRQAVEKTTWEEPGYTDALNVLTEVREKVRALPPVTPTRKVGKWVTKSHGFPPEPTTVCSECSFDRDFYIHHRGFDKIKYCPNCGIKMAESEG